MSSVWVMGAVIFGIFGQSLPTPTSLSYSNPIVMLASGPGQLMLPALALFGTMGTAAPKPAVVQLPPNPHAQPVQPVPMPVRPSIGPLPPPTPPVQIPTR